MAAALVTLFLFNAKAQDQETTAPAKKYNETVLIKVIETTYGGASGKAESKIITVKPDNSVETKTLDRASVLSDADESLSVNLVRIRTELQKWQNLGFHIQGISSASPMNYLVITTIIMSTD